MARLCNAIVIAKLTAHTSSFGNGLDAQRVAGDDILNHIVVDVLVQLCHSEVHNATHETLRCLFKIRVCTFMVETFATFAHDRGGPDLTTGCWPHSDHGETSLTRSRYR
jgi:hypothetical protein